MEERALDTSVEADLVQRAVWRRMGPACRLELALRMSDDVFAISVAGARARNPDGAEEGARNDVVRRLWGPELFDAWFAARSGRGGV